MIVIEKGGKTLAIALKSSEMPRLHKDLPALRRDWSFGDLVYWHLFEFGTRPNIDPAAMAGREWDAGAFCDLLGITDRTLRNWIFDKHLPDGTGALAHELFGDNPRWDVARLELIEALKKTRARKRKKGFVGALVSLVRPVEEERVAETAQGGDTSEPAAQEARELAASGSHLGAPKPQRSRLQSILPFVGRRAAETSKGALRTDPISPWYTFERERARPRPRQTKSAYMIVPGFALGIGAGIWAFRMPEAPPRQKTAVVVTPAPEPKENSFPQLPEKPAPVAPAIDASNEKPRQPPAVPPAAKPETKTPDPEQVEASRKAAEAERIARLAFAANQAAYDKKMRDEEAAARRRDQDADTEKELQATRAWNARQVAGIGYDLTENTAISGTSGGLVYVETIIDCALKCSEIGCDAFAFSSLGTTRHGCYRYRGPVTLMPHESYSVGKRVAPAAPVREEANNGFVATDANAPLPTSGMTAQAAPAVPADDLTRCANGPFKVTGFKLLCDKLIAGGGSPGSYRERYVVSTINQCAAYCRQASHCSGFTYHASQPGTQHDCQILGAGFITNDGAGWVSGVR